MGEVCGAAQGGKRIVLRMLINLFAQCRSAAA
jgi:hypothetical protein